MDTSNLKTDAPYTRYYCEENVYKLLETALAQTRATPATPAASPPSRQLFAVFVSNPQRKVLLFHQAASRVGPDMDNYVVWDYHVVAVSLDYGSDGVRRAVVLDRDSLLGFTVPLDGAYVALSLSDRACSSCSCVLSGIVYLQATFRPDLFYAGYLDPSLQRSVSPTLICSARSLPSVHNSTPCSMFRVVPATDFLQNFASDRSHMVSSRLALTAGTAVRLTRLRGRHVRQLVTTSNENATGVRGMSPSERETGSTASPVAKDSNAVYLQPPPPSPPICGSKARALGHTHNLFTHWLEMTVADATAKSTIVEEKGFGRVLGSAKDLRTYFTHAMEFVV